jgi:polyisoprenoid-binding protein YceI
MAETQTELTTWIVDPTHTLVEFASRYMTLTTVKGRFAGISGTIHASEPAAEAGRATVEVEIDAASLDTRDARRDSHLRSADFLDVERFPSIIFTSTRVEPIDVTHFRIRGQLTIRDISREIAFDVTRQGQAKTPTGLDVAGFTASTEINRKDFGLIWNVPLEAGGWLVGDTVMILLEVQAIRQD